MRFAICITLFLAWFYHGFAQQAKPGGTCRIRGRVVDSLTKQPIDYATVTVFAAGSTNVAGGIITDEKGRFSIDSLAPGTYTAKIDFIGYNTRSQANVVLNNGHPIANLGDVLISSGSKNLKEVTITGSRNFMENHLDKFVYNVEKDVTSQGGVATDVLKKVPQVSVDVDGNVELLGNANIRVFINGKPSSMFDNNLADALQSIPAGQIKSIEIITSPGAQYDAQGTGGIINIILKDNNQEGVNGNISVTGGTRLENVTGNVHIRKGKFDIGLSALGNWQLKSNTINSLNRATDSMQMNQTGQGSLERIGALPKLGVDYEINKTSSISASGTYSYLHLITPGIINQDVIDYYPHSDTETVRNLDGYSLFRAIDCSINYNKKFAREGQELSVYYQYNEGIGTSYYDREDRYAAAALVSSGGIGNDNWHDKENYIGMDYAHPLGEGIVINTGIKGTFSRVKDNSNHFTLDSAGSNYIYDPSMFDNFTYNRDVYAAYASVSFPLLKVYELKLGLRDEVTIMNMPGDTLFYDPSYDFFIPSAVISRKLENHQTLKISYSRRIQRPGYRSLNPFVNAADPSNIVQGNPALKPEMAHNVELSYYKFFEKGSSLLVTLYDRYSTQDLQNYILYYPSLPLGDTAYKNVAVITTVNAGNQNIAGINISGKLSLSQQFEIRGNLLFFDKYIVSKLDSGATSNSLNFRISGNANYQFSKTLVAEFFCSFNSRRTEIQGTFPAYTNYSFAIRKLLLNKKLGIAFTTTDPFNEYTNQATSITGTDFTMKIDRKIPGRSFGLNLSYKFGKVEYKEKKQEHDTNIDEGT